MPSPDGPVPGHYNLAPHDPVRVDGPRDPVHDRREPVVMPAEERELRAQIEHIRRGDRFPANDPVYQELTARLKAMDAEKRSEEEDTAEYDPVATVINQGDPINRLNGVASRLSEHHMFNSANEIGIAILKVKELTTERDRLREALYEMIQPFGFIIEPGGTFSCSICGEQFKPGEREHTNNCPLPKAISALSSALDENGEGGAIEPPSET